eukprot:CAMPEP_0119014052 /NCGR_PEP_ID=MMETSP1176-20130426/9328_1 /TAXON_ID=265551 /ORGANISM="Synedropsis recta cf, Strain CCMP1620" /LENGTH=291 /DNA_ID=CAMNT_0006967187 /DNA_START=14 /DNA_END=889 /DNA_ORIENTATION=-
MTLTTMMASYQAEFERIQQLGELPTFASKEHIQNELIPGTILSAVLVSILFVVSQVGVKRLTPKGTATFINDSAYLITTLVVNMACGIMGVYYYMQIEEADPSVDTMVLGSRIIVPLACLQVGKNIWAFPIGLTLFDETPAMLAHHVSVILVVTTSAVMTTGFGYFGPILFGILEWSSVPYAVMTFFKLNPAYIKSYSGVYSLVRFIFAIVFLYVRWYLTLPAMWSMLRLVGFRVYTLYEEGAPSTIAFFLLGFTWIATLFLAVLQVFWGVLIVKGVVKTVVKPKKKPKTA